MTHEFKNIVSEALLAKSQGFKSIMASVVDLDGSSYRKQGVRMLVIENGKMVGAVSGGCVEKEILLQSNSVFKTDEAKIMTYDGRYRLGCEGVLYILLEEFNPNKAFVSAFNNCLKDRNSFKIQSYYDKKEGVISGIGSYVKINSETYSVSGTSLKNKNRTLSIFNQNMPPCFKLVIIGAEHDAVQLCKYAALTGWEVTIISSVSESKSILDFPGANNFLAIAVDNIDISLIDNQTAIVLMTHNFANDLRYLVALKNATPSYVGMLGPTKRREDLLSQFIEYCPEITDEFLEAIHGPAGLNIGSETPQEIAISILSEILAFTRKKEPKSLSVIKGKIHSN